MRRILFRVLAAAVIASAVLASSTSASFSAATSTAPVARYAALDASNGILSVTGDPCSYFRVFGEMPDGTYAPVIDGLLDRNGACDVLVPHLGPTNDSSPQYAVDVTPPTGGTEVVFGVAADPAEEWWLD